MKLGLTPIRLASLAAALFCGTISIAPAKAISYLFGEQQVEQNRFIAIAVPFGEDNYNLAIVEQIPGKKLCWSENGSNPVTVQPLLLKFDFSGHCNRSLDSNGYSLRIGGQDYGLDYLLRIVKRDGELQLIATPRIDRTQPEISIGRSYGMNEGFVKIILDPGWEFSRRTYQNKALGHVYFSNKHGSMNLVGNRNEPSEELEP